MIEKESCRNEGRNETRQVHGKEVRKGGRGEREGGSEEGREEISNLVKIYHMIYSIRLKTEKVREKEGGVTT